MNRVLTSLLGVACLSAGCASAPDANTERRTETQSIVENIANDVSARPACAPGEYPMCVSQGGRLGTLGERALRCGCVPVDPFDSWQAR